MSIKSSTATIGLLLFSVLNLAAQSQWETLNPKPSGNIGVKIYFTSLDTGFIINNKQILKTVDCGQKWSVSKVVTSANDINFLKSTGYVVGNNGYVLKTTDKGINWFPVNIGTIENLNSVFVISRDTIIITGTNKLIKSFNGGTTWLSTDIPTCSVNKSFFTNSRTGHAACDPGKIIKTINGGQSWYITESVNYSPSDLMSIYFVNKNIGFASREHTDILKTIDGGEHWVKITNTSDRIYTFNFLDDQNGFIAGIYGVIHKTSNGGNTWSWAGFQTGRIDGTDINSLCFLNNNLGFAVGMRGIILKTTDGGMSWIQYAPTYTEIARVDFVSNNTGFAPVGNKILKTTDAGNTWEINEAPMAYAGTLKYSVVTENTGYCVVRDNLGGPYYIYKSTNGGQTWTNTNYNGLYATLSSIYFIDENTGYISGGTGVFRTTDGGNSWEAMSNRSFVSMQFLNNLAGYAKTYNQMYRTTDGGRNWTLSHNHTNEITSFHFTDEKTGYWTGGDVLYNTHDGGVTWNKVTVPYGSYVYVRFYSANIGFILDDYGKLFKTTNGGASWEEKYGPNESYYSSKLKSIEIFDDNIYVSGSGGLILKGKIEIPPVSLLLNPASGISNTGVTLTGNVTSNEGRIENFRFEYGISSFDQVISGVPNFADPGSAINVSANIKELIPNTSYNYRLKASYYGQDFLTDTLQFKTLPDYELTVYPDLISSNDAALYGRVVSNKGILANLEFQYGTDTTFASKISAVPNSVEEGIATTVRVNLTSLKPETKYYTRIKAIQNGMVRYSSVLYFNTKSEYTFLFYPPDINGNSVYSTIVITANKDTIRNIVLEYGTSLKYGRKVNTSPNIAYKNRFTYITSQILNLNTDSVYFYRIKGLMGSDIIYSADNIVSLNGKVVMFPVVNQTSNNSILVKALINPRGKFVNNIRIQYGLAGSFSDSTDAWPYVVCDNNTSTFSTTINNLEPNKQYNLRISANEHTNRCYSEVIVFTLGYLTGAELNYSDPEVLVYPNPASGYIYIRSPFIIKRSALIDLNGRVLLIKKEEKFIDVSAYPNGVYTLRLFINDKMITRRIIKQY